MKAEFYVIGRHAQLGHYLIHGGKRGREVEREKGGGEKKEVEVNRYSLVKVII